MSFSPSDILLVPVIFTDGSGRKQRPAIVLYDSGDADLVVAPLTSEAPRTPRDVELIDWRSAGLRLPSTARLDKPITIAKSTVIKKMGMLTPADWGRVKAVLGQLFADILSH
jgi:mRNA interferase MazF